MTFDEVKAGWAWKPIANCPGRFVLTDASPDLPPGDLIGPGVELREFRVATARDTVVVAHLSDGGLISYRRNDGSYLHTLNTSEGFARKLQMLGIT